MSDTVRARVLHPVVGELLLALALAFSFLVFGVWQRATAMGNLSNDWDGLANLLGMRLGGTPLGVQVFRFALWQLALHCVFGVVVWSLARLTRRALFSGEQYRLRMVLAWFAAGAIWLLVANATLFPWSVSGMPSAVLRVPIFADARVLELLTAALLASVATLMFLAARTYSARIRTLVARVALYGTVLAVAGLSIGWIRAAGDAQQGAAGPPDIIMIGIDSLRSDVVGAGRKPGVTPNIDAFVRDGGQMFTDAITPLARTFPSWTAILSGRHPRSTGARENLIPLANLEKFDTLAHIARNNGYHTVFATDEVRFSNIDESFGFDQVVSPTIGAADFLLGKFNDLPLANLVANTWLGRAMFPATFANRAAAVTYRPETFVRWIDAEVERQGPTMLAIHLTLPHMPYNWSAPGDQVFGRASDNSYQYSNAVIAADRQFGALIEILERKGMLRNSLVVVLSDHGEALGLPATDTLLRGAVAREMLDGQRISLWGHGSSVLSPHQYATFLALRAYGDVDLPAAFHEYDTPASLVDIAPTVIDLLGMKTTARFEGTSLKAVMAGEVAAVEAFARRPRFTETGFRTKKLEDGDFDERSVLGDVANYFRMNPLSARFELRPDLMPYLLADKERAALSGDWLLAAIPSRDARHLHKYVLVSRRGASPVRIEQAPPDDGSELSRLWIALHEHYGAELLPPAPRASPAAADCAATGGETTHLVGCEPASSIAP